MIRIAISAEAFEEIAAIPSLGSVAFEPQLGANGERFIWLEAELVSVSLLNGDFS
jgi:hypothetical protein